MRARDTTAAVIALGIAQAITSCRAIEGLGDFHFDGGAGGDGSSSSAGNTGGAGSASSAGNTGGAAGTEDCSNGVDDDGNGLVDCADPGCAGAGYACVSAVPLGWSGPLALHEGAENTTPVCAGPYPQASFQGGSAPKGALATCDACTCAMPSGACSDVDLHLYGGSSCSWSMGKITLSPGACSPLMQSVKGANASPSTPPASPCSPGGGAAHAPAIAWSSVAVACGGATLGAGCSTGQVCAPRALAPFSAARCIARAGDQSCPTPYPQKHALVEVVDQRGCSPCACDPLACDTKTQLFTDSSCQSALGTSFTAGSCAQATGAVTARATVTASCPASGGAPTGALQTEPWTLCCTL